jgi:hypothetical protein
VVSLIKRLFQFLMPVDNKVADGHYVWQFTNRIHVFAIVLFLSVGCVFFTTRGGVDMGEQGKWTVTDCIYFAIVTVSKTCVFPSVACEWSGGLCA